MGINDHLGYLTIDHRNSPGTNAVPGGTLFEADTYTCAHCQAIVIKNPLRQRPRNVCHKCMAVVCDNPICVKECSPFARTIERVIERAIRGIRGVLAP
jgi:hypothetical protein